MKRIVITGPESSGKTTLAHRIATHFNTAFVPEYARIYLASKGLNYSLQDLTNIAIGQLALATSMEGSMADKKLLIMDTWMLELCVWSQYKFGMLPEVLAEMYRDHPPHHYFLCKPDLDWQPDPLRENPLDRDVLFGMYEQALREGSVPYTLVYGRGPSREKLVVDAIQHLVHES